MDRVEGVVEGGSGCRWEERKEKELDLNICGCGCASSHMLWKHVQVNKTGRNEMRIDLRQW